MARRDRRPSRQALPLLDHLPDRTFRADRPRRLRLPAVLSTDEVARAQANQELIDQLWDFDDPAASETRFREAAESANAHLQPILLTQVGRALGLAGRYDEALPYLNPRDPLDREYVVRAILERGRVMKSRGESEQARTMFEDAFEAATSVGFDHLAVDALHMVAIVAPTDEQDELNRRALDLAAQSDDLRARQWRASLLNNIGWTAFDAGRYAEALAVFEDALDARRLQGKGAEIQVARWCVARTLRALDRVDQALAIQLELAAEHAAAGTTDPFVGGEIAECRTALDLKPG